MAIDEIGRDVILNHLGFGTGSRLVIAVPIIGMKEVDGLLGVGFSPHTDPNEDAVIGYLNAAASVIAQAIKVDRSLGDHSRRIEAENVNLRQELRTKYDFANLIGTSTAIRQVYGRMFKIAKSKDAVLLLGETGTGKEFLANAIHHNSLRAKRRFVHVNCPALDGSGEDIFGVATDKTLGPDSVFGEADGGTIYLEEIATLSATSQLRLLQVLVDAEHRRMHAPNVRLIASTSADLEDAVANGDFRGDLWRRLDTFSIRVPPLRERRSDILPLAESYLDKYASAHGKDIRRISTPAIDLLATYHFPGNVREVESVMERAVIACDTNVIHGHHLPPTLQTAELSGTESWTNLAAAVEAFESDLIQDALKSTGGNVTRAAKMLGSTERILGYKIKKYNISPARFRRWKAVTN
ncbi:MAG: sigma 54-interacting transcriptional regulator [Pyrinomonadaceae bacterium]